MVWPTTVSEDVLSGGGAKSFGQDLYDRDVEVHEMGWSWYFAQQTTTSTSYVTATTFRFRMPPWAIAGATVKVEVVIGNDAGGTTTCRLSDGTNDGTEFTTTATSETKILELTVPAGGYDDTVVEFEIHLKASSGTANVAGTAIRNMWVEE